MTILRSALQALLAPLVRRLAIRRVASDLSPGDLLAVRAEGSSFAVVKVLVVEPGAVHVRLYKQRFRTLPLNPNPGELSIGSFKIGESSPDPFSIGHLPITVAGLGLSHPVRIGRAPVLESELEGYRVWLDSHGGYFAVPMF